MYLYASEADPNGTAILMVVGSAIGGAVTYVVRTLWDWRNQRRKEAKEDGVNYEARQKALLDRLEMERVETREDYRKLEQHYDEMVDKYRGEIQRLHDQIGELEILNERAISWIKHVQVVLKTLNPPVTFLQWEDVAPVGGSQSHMVLPPDSGGPK